MAVYLATFVIVGLFASRGYSLIIEDLGQGYESACPKGQRQACIKGLNCLIPRCMDGELAVCTVMPPTCKYEHEKECVCDGALDENGACITFEQCRNQKLTPEKCMGPNEVFETCGTSCPQTCDDRNPDHFCPTVCVRGCFCKAGMLRRSDGVCVFEKDCNAKKCSASNEVYMECGTACPSTCEDPSPSLCTLQCVPGCFCKPGMLRRSDGVCVHENDCRASTGACMLPPESGPCKAWKRRYYYDSERHQCKLFAYGGCDGNDNNFRTELECMHKCGTPLRGI